MLFATLGEWQDFVLGLSLMRTVPDIVVRKFERAQKLCLLAWLDFELMMPAELTAFTALELALRDRYGDRVKDKKGNINFHRLLAYMPEKDGLTDDKLPINRRSGGITVGFLTGANRPTFAEIRNDLAHGYPFDRGPYGGLIEQIRDLIDYAYRNWPLAKQ